MTCSKFVRGLKMSALGLALAFLSASSIGAASHSCNCWEGDFICVIYDDAGNITGWIFQQNSSQC